MKRNTWAHEIRKVFPKATGDFCEYVLWERTAYPFANAAHIKRQIREFKFASDNLKKGQQLCDHCSRVAMRGKWMCRQCRDSLARA